MMDQKKQYTEDLGRYLGHIDSHLTKLTSRINEHDCCILSDFDQLQKLVSEAQNLAPCCVFSPILSGTL